MISLGLDTWRPEPSEKRAITLSDFPWLKGLLDPPSTAGVAVNQQSALSVSAYWNGVMMIAQSIGVLDRFLYRRVGDDDRERATTHPVYKLVHDQPNKYMTSQVFWETIAAHAVSWGNGYAEIEFDASSRPVALWPITPDKIQVKADVIVDRTGRRASIVWYEFNGAQRIEAEDMVHIPGLGFDGITGYSPVQMARRSLGLTIAAEEFGAAYFGNGSWTGAVLEHPGHISPEAFERIKLQRSQTQGPTKAHRLEILEEGMKLSRPLTIPPDDAQFLETREFQVAEVARWLNLPTWKLKVQQDARPGGNPEISQIDYLTDTLLPWTTRIEQELNRKLIPQGQRGTFFVEHLFTKILRADVTTRMSTYKSLFDLGVVDAQWIAKTENLPPPEETKDSLQLNEKVEALGQLIRAGFDPMESLAALGLPDIKHSGLQPVTVKAEEQPKPALPPGPDEAPEEDERMRAAHRALLMHAVAGFIKVESERAVRGAKKGPAAFAEWLRARRQEDQDTLRAALTPALRVLAAHRGWTDPETCAAELAADHVEASHEALLALPAKDLPEQVERLVASWEGARALQLAERGLSIETRGARQ